MEVVGPAVRPMEFAAGPRLGEYSPRACDRLADYASGGEYPPKKWTEARYYAHLACTHPGYELEQAPCVRLGHFVAKSVPTGHNVLEARGAAEGPLNASESESECTRPSVKAECAEFEKMLGTVAR